MGKGGENVKKTSWTFSVVGQNPGGQMSSPGSCSPHTTPVCQPPESRLRCDPFILAPSLYLMLMNDTTPLCIFYMLTHIFIFILMHV